MKCRYCRSTWDTDVKVKSCPFCGKSFLEEIDYTISSTISKIIEDYGLEILKSPKKVISYILDYVRGNEKDKRMFQVACGTDFLNLMYEAKKCSEEQQGLYLRKAKKYLEEEAFLSEQNALYIIDIVCEGIHIKSLSYNNGLTREMYIDKDKKILNNSENEKGQSEDIGKNKKILNKKEQSKQGNRDEKEFIETKEESPKVILPTIHQLSANPSFCIAVINKKGKIDVHGEKFEEWTRGWKHALAGWKDIIEIDSTSRIAVGLKRDGTVVATTINPHRVTDDLWDYGAACKVDSWSDIVQISCGRVHTVGLKNDGTVVAVGKNIDGECFVNNWSDIIQISAECTCTVGLKSNGRLVFAGYDVAVNRARAWTDIYGITLINIHATAYAIGIDKNHRIISTSDEIEELCKDWRDIVKVYTHFNSVIGICEDRSVVWETTHDSLYNKLVRGKYLINLYT